MNRFCLSFLLSTKHTQRLYMSTLALSLHGTAALYSGNLTVQHYSRRHHNTDTDHTVKADSITWNSPHKMHAMIYENANILALFFCDDKAEFSAAITPGFSVTWSFRNHSNMLICCSRNIYYYYQCWKQLCCLILLWKLWNTDKNSTEIKTCSLPVNQLLVKDVFLTIAAV